MNSPAVTPAQAGVPLPSGRSGIPAFAGMTRWLAALLLVAGIVAAPAWAQTFPPLTGRVVDQAHLLSAAQVQDITSKSEALEAQSGRQFVVATVNSLEGRPIEDYGYRLGRAWQIGAKGKNNGVILLVAPNERKVRVEVGYGATIFITDAVSGLIIRDAILPKFKQDPPDYGAGIVAGADAIMKQMSLPPEEAQKNVANAERSQQQRQHSGGNPLPIFFWALVIGFVILSHLRRRFGRRYRSRRGGISPWVVLWGLNELSRGSRSSGWGGGSSWGGGGGGWGGGGGGFSGGGGSFGGGGASGSW